MKRILGIVALLTITIASFGQTTNILSPADFRSISLNGVTIEQIQATNGNTTQIIALFGQPTNVVNHDNTPGVISKSIHYTGLKLGFSSLIPADGHLTRMEITNGTPIINIKGKSFKVGDNRIKLGTYLINDFNNQTINFMPSNDETVVLSVRFNPSTGLITEVIFFVMT